MAALHHEMQDTPYQANRTLGVLSKMMNLAEAWELRPDRSNPCYHVRKFREGKRERFLTGEELTRLGKALDEEEPFAPSAVTAYRLTITRLVGTILLKQNNEWAVARRYMSLESITPVSDILTVKLPAVAA